jgi:hypothetical protein
MTTATSSCAGYDLDVREASEQSETDARDHTQAGECDDEGSKILSWTGVIAGLVVVCVWSTSWRHAAELGGVGPVAWSSALGIGLWFLDLIPVTVACWGVWLVAVVPGASTRGFVVVAFGAALALLPAVWVLLRIHQRWALMEWTKFVGLLPPLLGLVLAGIPLAFLRRVAPAIEDDKLPVIPTIDEP